MCMTLSILRTLVSRSLPNFSCLSPCVLLSSFFFRIISSLYSLFKVRKGKLWFYLEFLLPQFLAFCSLPPNGITWTQYIAHSKCSPLIRSFLQRFERDCCWRIFLSTLQTLCNLQFWNLSSQHTVQIVHSTAPQSINREVRAKTYLKKISSRSLQKNCFWKYFRSTTRGNFPFMLCSNKVDRVHGKFTSREYWGVASEII